MHLKCYTIERIANRQVTVGCLQHFVLTTCAISITWYDTFLYHAHLVILTDTLYKLIYSPRHGEGYILEIVLKGMKPRHWSNIMDTF